MLPEVQPQIYEALPEAEYRGTMDVTEPVLSFWEALIAKLAFACVPASQTREVEPPEVQQHTHSIVLAQRAGIDGRTVQIGSMILCI